MSAAVSGKRRIVLVDDDPELIDRMRQLLSDDYELRATTDWAELNKLFFREGCDLVLMDVNLPTLKGDRLVQILTGTPQRGLKTGIPFPKIVYFSAEDDGTLAKLARETHADGFLSKSLRGPALLKEIAHFLRRSP